MVDGEAVLERHVHGRSPGDRVRGRVRGCRDHRDRARRDGDHQDLREGDQSGAERLRLLDELRGVQPSGPAGDLAGKTPKKKVPSRKRKHSVVFAFSSATAGATFECSIDGKAFRACKSGHKFKLKVGRHTFAVRALALGLTDATPATYGFRIKRRR
jgi:hypothetical protein